MWSFQVLAVSGVKAVSFSCWMQLSITDRPNNSISYAYLGQLNSSCRPIWAVSCRSILKPNKPSWIKYIFFLLYFLQTCTIQTYHNSWPYIPLGSWIFTQSATQKLRSWHRLLKGFGRTKTENNRTHATGKQKKNKSKGTILRQCAMQQKVITVHSVTTVRSLSNQTVQTEYCPYHCRHHCHHHHQGQMYYHQNQHRNRSRWWHHHHYPL